jgi:hypothetical protein
MKFLLDTNVISEAVKSDPSKSVLKMLKRHQDESLSGSTLWQENCTRSLTHLSYGSVSHIQVF